MRMLRLRHQESCCGVALLPSCCDGVERTVSLVHHRRELNRLLPRHARRHSLDQTGFIRQQADSPEQLPFKVGEAAVQSVIQLPGAFLYCCGGWCDEHTTTGTGRVTLMFMTA